LLALTLALGNAAVDVLKPSRQLMPSLCDFGRSTRAADFFFASKKNAAFA
jgi:hypothetical protein